MTLYICIRFNIISNIYTILNRQCIDVCPYCFEDHQALWGLGGQILQGVSQNNVNMMRHVVCEDNSYFLCFNFFLFYTFKVICVFLFHWPFFCILKKCSSKSMYNKTNFRYICLKKSIRRINRWSITNKTIRDPSFKNSL